MLIWIYRLLFIPGLLLAGPYYLWRMRRRGGYAPDFGQRFGIGLPRLPAKPPGRARYWIQAVSVGELLGIEPLVRELARNGAQIVLTTTTSTARKLAEERFRDVACAIAYFPLDGWPSCAAAWRRFQPDVMLLMEGELWPEHLYQGRARGCPIVRINARLSDRSYRRMRALAPLARWLLQLPAWSLCSSEQDRQRLLALGAEECTTRTVGSLKVDAPLDSPLEGCALLDLLESLGFEDRPVIVGASTWEGEEGALLLAFEQCRDAGFDCRLLLVPRHAERREALRSLLAGTRWRFHLRSRGGAPEPVDVCIADTTGELRRLVQTGTVVFAGKSLPPHREGQTPIEAAGYGKPVVFGPGMSNFRAVAAELLECGAAVQVKDGSALGDVLKGLLGSPERRSRMGNAGAAWHTRNRGALARTLALLDEEICRHRPASGPAS